MSAFKHLITAAANNGFTVTVRPIADGLSTSVILYKDNVGGQLQVLNELSAEAMELSLPTHIDYVVRDMLRKLQSKCDGGGHD